MEDCQSVVFGEGQELRDIVNHGAPGTTLTAWFNANEEFEEAKEIGYSDFPRYFTYNKGRKRWQRRVRGGCLTNMIGRLRMVNPRDKERFYLRKLLCHRKGATCFEDLRRLPNGVVCSSYYEAGKMLGIVDPDDLWRETMEEAALICRGKELRSLFVTILCFNDGVDYGRLFDEFVQRMGDDFFVGSIGDDIDERRRSAVLKAIKLLLADNNRDMGEFPGLPALDEGCESEDRDEEFWRLEDLDEKIAELNVEQRMVFDNVLDIIRKGYGKVVFIKAAAGTGMCFMWNVGKIL